MKNSISVKLNTCLIAMCFELGQWIGGDVITSPRDFGYKNVMISVNIHPIMFDLVLNLSIQEEEPI